MSREESTAYYHFLAIKLLTMIINQPLQRRKSIHYETFDGPDAECSSDHLLLQPGPHAPRHMVSTFEVIAAKTRSKQAAWVASGMDVIMCL